jgi:protein tyrosine phosphatase (PTP) superfamily phosphohydrolase (DUF442 family)
MTPKLFCRLALVASVGVLPAHAWADVLGVPGIPNFCQVNDRICRGAQPSQDAWPKLARLGVQTVIDLRQRQEHAVEAESTAVYAAGMRYVNFPMNGFEIPTTGQIENVLNLLDRDEHIFIHCKLGKDRTGTVVAAYRISRERWTNAKALAEAKQNGLHWYERGMKRFLWGYHRDTNPDGPPGVEPSTATVNATSAR